MRDISSAIRVTLRRITRVPLLPKSVGIGISSSDGANDSAQFTSLEHLPAACSQLTPADSVAAIGGNRPEAAARQKLLQRKYRTFPTTNPGADTILPLNTSRVDPHCMSRVERPKNA
jgi:hypothetical protein